MAVDICNLICTNSAAVGAITELYVRCQSRASP